MSKSLAYLTLLVAAATLVVISVAKPMYLSDANGFLRNFVNHEFLNVLGVFLAITLASVANIHLAFNRIEERHSKRNALVKSRQNLKKTAYWLISLFCVGGLVVIVKPVACTSEISVALFNSAAIIIVLWHVLILISLTELVFRIEPEFPPAPEGGDDGHNMRGS